MLHAHRLGCCRRRAWRRLLISNRRAVDIALLHPLGGVQILRLGSSLTRISLSLSLSLSHPRLLLLLQYHLIVRRVHLLRNMAVLGWKGVTLLRRLLDGQD